MQTEQDILALIEEDVWMMEILKAAQSLELPDWWICAGFVRSKIWDALHGFNEKTTLKDINVIYFDPENLLERKEKELEKKLNLLLPGLPWNAFFEVFDAPLPAFAIPGFFLYLRTAA